MAGIGAVVGLGGGTGGEIILRVMHALPFDFPKVLITTLPFDPRPALADNSIILVPTLVDIAGLNPTLRQVFAASAGMIAGLAQAPAPHIAAQKTVGLTALGATGGAAEALVAGFREIGEESTVFHANGYGGAAFARFAEAGAFKAIVDMTVHELNRWLFAGAYVDMPTRFTAAGDLPRVVLPGGLNFLGLGALDTVPQRAARAPALSTHRTIHTCDPHPRGNGHSRQGARRASQYRDRPGTGDRADGRVLASGCARWRNRGCRFARDLPRRAQVEAKAYSVDAITHHINAPETAAQVIEALKPHIKRPGHA